MGDSLKKRRDVHTDPSCTVRGILRFTGMSSTVKIEHICKIFDVAQFQDFLISMFDIMIAGVLAGSPHVHSCLIWPLQD